MREVERGRAQQPCPMHPCSVEKQHKLLIDVVSTYQNIITIIINNTTYDADGLVANLGKKQENNLQIA